MTWIKKIWLFYYEGFKNMTVGKSLWAIILVKLVIIFLILRVFFFKPALAEYDTDIEKSAVVIENLTKQN